MEKKLYFFVGTTAELIKLFPVMKELNHRKIPFKVIASGQNNLEGSSLFTLAGVEGADITLHQVGIKQSALGLLGWFFRTLRHSYKVLKPEFAGIDARNSFIIVHGDTVSTVMGALIARHFKMKVAHIEAGLRSFNYLNPFPEEIDRVIVSRYATISFCPNQWAVDNLKGKSHKIVNTLQNTLVDSLAIATKEKAELSVTREILGLSRYFVFVLHRQENLYNEKLVKLLLDSVVKLAEQTDCVFILHEPTKVALEKYGILAKLQKNKHMKLVPRLPYVDFMKVLDKSEFIITDGGSNQEESYYMGKPCLVLRRKTERIEGLGENVCLSMLDEATIRSFIDNPAAFARKPIVPAERPSAIIADHLSQAIHE
jgi:UDP-N-acetylglucosamine 2-epimerase (non-hydrolysing)